MPDPKKLRQLADELMVRGKNLIKEAQDLIMTAREIENTTNQKDASPTACTIYVPSKRLWEFLKGFKNRGANSAGAASTHAVSAFRSQREISPVRRFGSGSR
jgi:hypothetical protein